MNIERILHLAEVIEKTPHGNDLDLTPKPLTHFNMEGWHCGAAGCIGGWVEELYDEDGTLYGNTQNVADILGIDNLTAYHLCYPPSIIPYSDITPAQAAATLRRLAREGEVIWDLDDE